MTKQIRMTNDELPLPNRYDQGGSVGKPGRCFASVTGLEDDAKIIG